MTIYQTKPNGFSSDGSTDLNLVELILDNVVVGGVVILHLCLRRQPAGTTLFTNNKDTVELVLGDVLGGLDSSGLGQGP